MTDNNGAPAPASGDDGTSGQPAGGPPSNSDSPPDGQPDSRNGDGIKAGWDEIAKEFGDPEKVRKALAHARTWEQRAKENKAGAQQAQTLEQQLEQMRQQMTARDEKDKERSAKTATAQLRAELAQAGVKWDDVDEVLRPDPLTLLKDGEPDEDRITRIAAALARQAGRPAPDPDQGKRSNGIARDTGGAGDMNEMFRSAVRARRH